MAGIKKLKWHLNMYNMKTIEVYSTSRKLAAGTTLKKSVSLNSQTETITWYRKIGKLYTR